jgi:hypothetical protein
LASSYSDPNQLQDTNPFWMPAIGLGIGYERGDYSGLTRDWLYWYSEDGNRYPTPAEQIKQGQVEITQAQIEVIQARMKSIENARDRLN